MGRVDGGLRCKRWVIIGKLSPVRVPGLQVYWIQYAGREPFTPALGAIDILPDIYNCTLLQLG